LYREVYVLMGEIMMSTPAVQTSRFVQVQVVTQTTSLHCLQ